MTQSDAFLGPIDDDASRPLQRHGVVLLAASLTALFVPVYYLQGLRWPEAGLAAASFTLPCVALGVVVWRAQGQPWLNRRGVLGGSMHLLAAGLFSGAWTAIFAAAVSFIRPGEAMDFLRDSAIWQFVWGLIVYGALVMAARVRKRLQQQKLAAATAELAALRAQLNPHFLFNTLHSLMQLSREDPAATERALERFGGLMRYVLQAGKRPRHEVALEEELRFVQDYLALERLRLADRLRVVEDIEEAALDCSVPPLLLQPLVENAVRHGIAPLRRGGTLRLAAHVSQGWLRLAVEDDGVGADRDSCLRSAGLGLTAVRRQAQAMRPAGADVEVETTLGAGFRVRLSLPARSMGEDDHDDRTDRR